MPNKQEVSDVRSSKRARLLTPGFSLIRHLCVFGGITIAGIVVAIWLARRARPVDLWIVPAYLLVANAAEYLTHRLLMHRPLWPRRLYEGHTLGHHRAFHHDSMEVASWRELDLVMMPWFTIAIFFAGMTPIALLVAGTLGQGPAGLLLLAAVASFTAYEGMHAVYHFPRRLLERAGLFDNQVFRFLYRHHRHHHRLVRMRWVNFNISLPLADRLLGTIETEASWQTARAQRLRDRDARNETVAGAAAAAADRDDADPEAA